MDSRETGQDRRQSFVLAVVVVSLGRDPNKEVELRRLRQGQAINGISNLRPRMEASIIAIRRVASARGHGPPGSRNVAMDPVIELGA
jgi:hypothetical protein